MKKSIIYLGLFDKDSKCQEVSTLDAYKIAENLLVEYIGYGTITECSGVYTHDSGEIVREPSLRIEVSGANCEQMKKACHSSKNSL